MSEEHLVLGRPPRPPRRGWTGRAARVTVAAAVVAAAGWAVWQGVRGEPGPEPGDTAATTTPPVSPGSGTGHVPPAVPYLRSGKLLEPDGEVRGLPDGSWVDFAQLADGRVVLVEPTSLLVLGPDRERDRYAHTGGLSARPDGRAVAWTGSDGRLRRLSAGDAEPVVVAGGARQLDPACRGLRTAGAPEPGWATCDRDGHLLSPDGHYLASIGQVSVTLAPRADITGGISVAVLGTVRDAVWEDPWHLLAVVGVADEAQLIRIGVDGTSEDVIEPVRGEADPSRPLLVLPAAIGPGWDPVQP